MFTTRVGVGWGGGRGERGEVIMLAYLGAIVQSSDGHIRLTKQALEN